MFTRISSSSSISYYLLDFYRYEHELRQKVISKHSGKKYLFNVEHGTEHDINSA